MSDGSLLRQAFDNFVNFQHKTLVLKMSGKIFAGQNVAEIIEDAANLASLGVNVVVVCGCQGQTDQAMREQGIEVVKINGIRVSSPRVIDLMEGVYIRMEALVSEIISKFKRKPKIVWLRNAIVARPLSSEFEMTGEVSFANPMAFNQPLIKHYYAPLIHFVTALARGEDGLVYNINADNVAAAIASSSYNGELVFLGDGGVRMNNELLPRLSVSEAEKLITRGTATEGMIPKLRAAIAVIQSSGGRVRVHFVGSRSGELLQQILTTERSGTIIEPDKKE